MYKQLQAASRTVRDSYPTVAEGSKGPTIDLIIFDIKFPVVVVYKYYVDRSTSQRSERRTFYFYTYHPAHGDPSTPRTRTVHRSLKKAKEHLDNILLPQETHYYKEVTEDASRGALPEDIVRRYQKTLAVARTDTRYARRSSAAPSADAAIANVLPGLALVPQQQQGPSADVADAMAGLDISMGADGDDDDDDDDGDDGNLEADVNGGGDVALLPLLQRQISSSAASDSVEIEDTEGDDETRMSLDDDTSDAQRQCLEDVVKQLQQQLLAAEEARVEAEQQKVLAEERAAEEAQLRQEADERRLEAEQRAQAAEQQRDQLNQELDQLNQELGGRGEVQARHLFYLMMSASFKRKNASNTNNFQPCAGDLELLRLRPEVLEDLKQGSLENFCEKLSPFPMDSDLWRNTPEASSLNDTIFHHEQDQSHQVFMDQMVRARRLAERVKELNPSQQSPITLRLLDGHGRMLICLCKALLERGFRPVEDYVKIVVYEIDREAYDYHEAVFPGCVENKNASIIDVAVNDDHDPDDAYRKLVVYLNFQSAPTRQSSYAQLKDTLRTMTSGDSILSKGCYFKEVRAHSTAI